jgi:hypothetical protein
MAPPARTAVVHLVRHANGPEPFERFLGSYERHDPGCEHDLVLLFKGFEDAAARGPYRERAADHAPLTLAVDDRGFDLGAYVAAAQMLDHERVCFVNSFSEVLAPGWLALLDAALADRAVGAAGATGSWASHRSYDLFQLGLPGPYADAFESRRAAREAMHELSGTPVPSDLPHWLYTLVTTLRRPRGTARFPAVHLRTNAFLLDRALFCSLRTGALHTKPGTYRLESGRRSITAQLRARGRPPVVVDSAGAARHVPDWHLGDVFFQGGQRDLLVGDNQTRGYDAASTGQRRVLSTFAWGERARP